MHRMGVVVAAMALACSVAVQAQDEDKTGFKNTLSAGLNLTDGNSETMQANAALLSEGEKEGLGSVRAGLEGNYGKSTVNSNKETTVKNIRAFANARKTITPMTFGSLNAEALYDDIAEIDYRAMAGPGLGAYAVKNERLEISGEAGPTYVWEKVAGEKDDYLALRFGERADWKLSETAKLWQSVDYLPRVDDFGDYLLKAELGAEAALNSRLNLRVVLQDKYDSTPGEGLKHNDISLISGISVSL